MGILKRWKVSIYKKMLKYKILFPQVVVLIDGGICSQMHQFLLGQLYKTKGFQVSYDLSFYRKYGMDKDGKFVRNFDLLKAFPDLELKVASDFIVSFYQNRYYNIGNNTTSRMDDFSFLQKKAPLYLGGYYHLPADIWLPAFRSIYKLDLNVLDNANIQLYNKINNCQYSVAVHVRRGDLKVEMYDYGKPASVDYFTRSISYFQKKHRSPSFYFFSDEPDWVLSDLIPQLPVAENEWKVVDINGSDKGYMDLYLIASCKHQITSKGTLGKYGALINDNPEKIVVLCDDEIEYSWKELLKNPVFL